MPSIKPGKKSNFAGTGGFGGVKKGAKIRTPFEYPMADKGGAKGGKKRSFHSKGGSKR